MNDKFNSIKVSNDTYEKLKKIKKNTGITITYMVDEAVEEYLKKRNKRGSNNERK